MWWGFGRVGDGAGGGRKWVDGAEMRTKEREDEES